MNCVSSIRLYAETKMTANIPNETNYRQYHDEKLFYHSQTMVYFSQCNPNQNISLNELLKLTSDVAVEDFNRRNMSRESLAANGVAILVSRDSFRIHSYPQENQHITIHTWEEKSEPLQFVRAFEINAEDGKSLVSGITSWLLVDLKARRIMPIKKFDAMGLREPTTYQSEHNCLPYGKINIPEDVELFDERVIKFTDLDANGHTNNSRYAAFALDALPVEYQDRDFKDVRLNFAKEAMFGQKLSIFGKVDEQAKVIVLVGKTVDGISFEAELSW